MLTHPSRSAKAQCQPTRTSQPFPSTGTSHNPYRKRYSMGKMTKELCHGNERHDLDERRRPHHRAARHVRQPPARQSTRTTPRGWYADNGADMWKFRDRIIPNVALNAVAGRPRRSTAWSPRDSTDPARLLRRRRTRQDMNAGGVLAGMNFPSFPGFAARLFATEDSDFSLALVQACNDWHIDEWCGGIRAGSSRWDCR